MRSGTFHRLPSASIALGATSPDPGAAGTPVWSTTEACVLFWDGTSWAALRERAVVEEVFTANGTWTKPAGARRVLVRATGGGGGGGSGRKGTGTGAHYGGAGGAKGQTFERWFAADDLTSTVAVTIGSGGAGGAARTADSTNGAQGSSGTSTTFGAYVTALGGEGGLGGTSSTLVAHQASPPDVRASGGIAIPAARQGITYPPGHPANPAVTTYSAVGACFGGAGGYGGAINASTFRTGSDGQSPHNDLSAPPGGATVGAAGANGEDLGSPFALYASSGAGGASGNTTGTNAGAGGNGGRGCGGGGGGAGYNSSSNSGAGGAGGNGWVQVVTYFY